MWSRQIRCKVVVVVKQQLAFRTNFDINVDHVLTLINVT